MIVQILSILKLFFTSIFGGSTGMRKYFLLTAGLAMLMTVAFVYVIKLFIDQVKDFILSLIPYDWAQGSWILSVIIGIAGLFVFISVFKYVLIIMLSPLLSYISEKTEIKETGKKTEMSFSFWNATGRSIRINSRNMVKEWVISILLFIVSFIPILNFVSIPMLFMVQAYFMGFGIMDFYLERHHTMNETIGVVYKNKWAAMSLGGIFMVIIAIPILGAILAPYYATIVGTKYFSKVINPEKITHS